MEEEGDRPLRNALHVADEVIGLVIVLQEEEVEEGAGDMVVEVAVIPIEKEREADHAADHQGEIADLDQGAGHQGDPAGREAGHQREIQREEIAEAVRGAGAWTGRREKAQWWTGRRGKALQVLQGMQQRALQKVQ